jgi:hypothetical protein
MDPNNKSRVIGVIGLKIVPYFVYGIAGAAPSFVENCINRNFKLGSKGMQR